MSRLDMIIIRALLDGKVTFDAAVPTRFARVGEVRLYRPVTLSADRWAVLFGHCEKDHGLPFGRFANWAMMIALRAHLDAKVEVANDTF